MSSEEIAERLEHKHIKATANRILVYRELAQRGRPLSLGDLEHVLLSMDKSSIFRVLTLFLEHDVVHAFTDGRGVLCYELCGSDGDCHNDDTHLHFFCESCQKTYCLDHVHLDDIALPQGFTVHSASFVLKGECPECRQKQ